VEQFGEQLLAAVLQAAILRAVTAGLGGGLGGNAVSAGAGPELLTGIYHRGGVVGRTRRRPGPCRPSCSPTRPATTGARGPSCSRTSGGDPGGGRGGPDRASAESVREALAAADPSAAREAAGALRELPELLRDLARPGRSVRPSSAR
jgi:hypothetical protein